MNVLLEYLDFLNYFGKKQITVPKLKLNLMPSLIVSGKDILEKYSLTAY